MKVNVLKVIVNTVVILLLVVIAAVSLSQLFGVRYFTVVSGSMEPEIGVGSLVVALPPELTGKEYQPGDVVSYVADEDLTVVTHRVVSVDQKTRTLITQGDANTNPDPEVLMANVVGSVELKVPYLGYPLLYLSTLTGKIVAVVVGVLIVLCSILVNSVNPQSKKKRLVITYENPEDLTPETFEKIRKDLEKKAE